MLKPLRHGAVIGAALGIAAFAACGDAVVVAPGGGAGGATVSTADVVSSSNGSGGGSSSSSGGAAASGGAAGVGGVGGAGSVGGGAQGGSGGAGGAGGAGGSGGGWMPPTGMPISATDLTWTWVDFPEAKCRDGSATGIGVSLNSASDNVMILLQGGGACFNATTCANNPSSYGSADFSGPTGGIFDRNNADNPVADWNFVFVPYCTGDIHAGNKPDSDVPGVGMQQFVGYANIDAYLERLVPTFIDADHVLLTGISAGGYGASLTADLVMRKFGPIQVSVLDDSGPPVGNAQASQCLQDLWRTLWGLDGTVLADCGVDCAANDDFLVDWWSHLLAAHPGRRFGLYSTQRDLTIRTYLGQGTDNCTGFLPIDGALFQQGLDDFQVATASAANLGTYFNTGVSHTVLGGVAFYSTTVDNVALTDWVSDWLAGTVTDVAP